MMGINLEDNIISFVREFGVVKVHHVMRFFSDQQIHRVEFALKHLLQSQQLFIIEIDKDTPEDEMLLSFVRKEILPYRDNINVYLDMFPALDILVHMGSNNIKSYSRFKSPCYVTFMTTDNSIFDVVILNLFQDEWINTLNAVKIQRSAIFQFGAIPDTINHIAVVPSSFDPLEPKNIREVTLLKQLSLFRFRYIHQVNPNGNVENTFELNIPDPLKSFFSDLSDNESESPVL